MTQITEKLALVKAHRAAVLVLAVILLGGAGRLQAQSLAVPGNMPILYQEIPEYVKLKPRARHKVNLAKCIIEPRTEGYYLVSGDREFVILNQNPACLKRYAGKSVAVRGRTTENPVTWFQSYFIVIDEIDGKRYEGKVTPWVMREPTDEEIRYWCLHKQLPPATQKFMTYLALPRTEREPWLAENGSDNDNLTYCALTPESKRALPEGNVDRQLTAIQKQLTAIEQKVSKPAYRGIYSVPEEDWNATDWSLYMDLRGGG